MNFILLLMYVLLLITVATCTLSPPTEKTNKKTKGKILKKKGPTSQDVFQRRLVVKEPEAVDIIRDYGQYYNDTNIKRYNGDVLAYITPWHSSGYEIAKIFHKKLTMVSPVWLTVPFNNSAFQISTHDMNKEWLREMNALNTPEHSVKVLPRLLFEGWVADNILELYRHKNKQTQLINLLTDIATTFQLNGYVLEMWNQFIFTGVDIKIILSLIKTLAQELNTHNIDLILAVPPSRGKKVQLFSQIHFEELAPYIKAFSLMTYDYSNIQRPGPNSPIDWAQECVKLLVPKDNDDRRSQILLGINFYGYKYTSEGGGPIIGTEYIKLLESVKGKIQWDDKSKEHFFELKSNMQNAFVFYPTLYSLLHRLDLSAELGTGISIWELGQGLNYFYDLL